MKMHKYQNAFLFQDIEKVKSVEEKDSFLLVELHDTIFYPGGGGQPCDTGIMKTESFFGEVVEVLKENEKIIHKVKTKHGHLKPEEKVELEINKERRTKLIRMHTGEHILFKSLELTLGEISLDKINLGEEESSLFIFAQNLTWENLFKAEELVNKIIEENRPIIEKEYPKTDAVIMNKLRIKPERIKSETVRVLEIKEFDWSACTGTHASSTGFVENLLITKYNFIKGSWEIRFKTNVKKDFFDLAKVTRESATLLQTEPNNILTFIKRLQEESESYKERFRKFSYELMNNYHTEKINHLNLIYNVVEEVEKKQLVDKATSLLKEKTVVCFVNKAEGRATVLLSCSLDLKLNIPEILNKALSKFNGKGGGRDNFAMGAVEEKYSEDIIKEVKEILSKV